MKVTRTIVSLAAAAVLTLSACGGDDTTTEQGSDDVPAVDAEDAGADDAAGDEAASDDAEAPAQDDAAGAGDGTDLGAESPENSVSAPIEQFIASNEGGQRMPQEALTSATAMEALETMEIEPAECKELSRKTAELQSVDDAERDGGMVLDETTGLAKTVLITKYADAAAAEEVYAAQLEVVEKCGELTIGQGGQNMTMTQEGEETSIDGASKALNHSSSTDLGGSTQFTWGSVAIKDEYVVTASASGAEGAASTDDTQALAAEMIAALG